MALQVSKSLESTAQYLENMPVTWEQMSLNVTQHKYRVLFYHHRAEPIPVKWLCRHQLKYFDQLSPTHSRFTFTFPNSAAFGLGAGKTPKPWRSTPKTFSAAALGLWLLFLMSFFYTCFIYSHPGGWQHKERRHQHPAAPGALHFSSPVARWFWCPITAALAACLLWSWAETCQQTAALGN